MFVRLVVITLATVLMLLWPLKMLKLSKLSLAREMTDNTDDTDDTEYTEYADDTYVTDDTDDTEYTDDDDLRSCSLIGKSGRLFIRLVVLSDVCSDSYRQVGDSSDVTLAFEDAQIIQTLTNDE